MAAADVHRALLDRGVAHEVVRLRRPVASADDLPVVLGLPPGRCVAVRCYVTDGGDVVAVLVRAGEVPDPLALSAALGTRAVRAATATEVNAATDCSVGLVSPVGLPGAVQVLADAGLTTDAAAVVYTAAAEAGVALGILATDLLVAAGARSVPLSARPLALPERDRVDGVLDLDAAAADTPREAIVLDLRSPDRGHLGAG